MRLRTWEEFRDAARGLLEQGVPPEGARLEDGWTRQLALVQDPEAPRAQPARTAVPRAFVELGERAACHTDPLRWALLYRVLWRLSHGERTVLDDPLDPDGRALRLLARAVDHDVHKVHAFVRFREVEGRWVAWHRPLYRCVRLAAPFFEKRFPNLAWSLLTPDESAHWDGAQLTFGPGLPREAAPAEDELDGLWRTYYTSIFNPARLNLGLLRQHVPVHHWDTLPELRELPLLVREAPRRTGAMLQAQASASDAFIPELRGLASAERLTVLRQAARACRACELCEPATQTVFGEGPPEARIVLVGEQPGDQEDLAGRPFVGPAGGVLDEALREAALDRAQLYLTNAVKHFKFEPRGKLRLHARPSARDVAACRGWLSAELESLRPRVVVCLGATAARALLGAKFALSRNRGAPQPVPFARAAVATWHPSAILRAGTPAEAAAMRAELVGDLRRAAALSEAGWF